MLSLPRTSASMSSGVEEDTMSFSAFFIFRLLRYMYSSPLSCHSSQSPPAAAVCSMLCALSPILFKNAVSSPVNCVSSGMRSSMTSAISLSMAMSESNCVRSRGEDATLALDRFESRLSTIELSSYSASVCMPAIASCMDEMFSQP